MLSAIAMAYFQPPPEGSVKENFFPNNGWGGRPDTYVMVVEFSDGSRNVFEYTHIAAIKMDALYDAGSVVRYDRRKFRP